MAKAKEGGCWNMQEKVKQLKELLCPSCCSPNVHYNKHTGDFRCRVCGFKFFVLRVEDYPKVLGRLMMAEALGVID